MRRKSRARGCVTGTSRCWAAQRRDGVPGDYEGSLGREVHEDEGEGRGREMYCENKHTSSEGRRCHIRVKDKDVVPLQLGFGEGRIGQWLSGWKAALMAVCKATQHLGSSQGSLEV